MYSVYVPFENINNYSYYYFSNDMSLIYASNDNINFTIIDIENHYTLVDNYVLNDISNLILIDNNNLTNNWFYRNDVTDISLLVVIFSVFFFYIPIKLFSKLFKRGGF